MRDYYKKNREKWNSYTREYRRKGREKIKALIGDKCIFCGKKEIYFHEIYNKKHSRHNKYILKHIEDFIPLCDTCHQGVHFLMRIFGLTWDDIRTLGTYKLYSFSE